MDENLIRKDLERWLHHCFIFKGLKLAILVVFYANGDSKKIEKSTLQSVHVCNSRSKTILI